MGRKAIGLFVPIAVGIMACSSDPLPLAKMSQAPDSIQMAFEEIADPFERDIDEQEALGYVIAVGQAGEPVWQEAIGRRTLQGDPMRIDTRFRVASLTKPVTAVAVLTLMEMGLIDLDQPVSDFLPSFAEVQVWADGSLRPPSRPIVVRDLFIHTSGIGYRHDRETVIGRRYIEAAPYEKSASLEDAVETLASLPLYFDPGERVFYGYSTEVLGRIVEVVSGQPFDEYVTDTILQPLGMADTSFFVPEADEGRLASVVQKSGDGSLQAVRGDVFGDPLSEYTWPSPGAGLVSTAPDYLRFAMMLERGGELDGVRIVSRQSVELMTTDHLPESIRQRIEGTPLAGRGFGLGVAVTLDSKVASDPGRDGDYTWSGFYDTQFFVSPTTETVAVMMVQRQPRDDEPDRQTGRRFKEAVFRVLDQNSQE